MADKERIGTERKVGEGNGRDCNGKSLLGDQGWETGPDLFYIGRYIHAFHIHAAISIWPYLSLHICLYISASPISAWAYPLGHISKPYPHAAFNTYITPPATPQISLITTVNN